jgi:DNA polymerase V
MVALVDCNNFYASCERVFRPELQGRPVAVLSNNDGCLVSRSDEVKALGIPGAAPAFKYKHLFAQHGVSLFSSNYTLYADLSNRVVDILRQFTPELEVYSIDEAFMQLGGLPQTLAGEAALLDLGRQVRRRVLQWLDLPVSVGIAPTRTLAKIANHYVKKHKADLPDGVLALTQPAHIAHRTHLFDYQTFKVTSAHSLGGMAGAHLGHKPHKAGPHYPPHFKHIGLGDGPDGVSRVFGH